MNKNIINPKSKIKHATSFVVMAMLILFVGVLAACNTGANNLKLTPSQDEVVLYLDNKGGDEKSLSVFASGANDDVLKDLYISSTSNLVKITNQRYLGDGRTDFTISGSLQEESATVLIQSQRNLKKMAQIKVKVVDPLVSLLPSSSAYSNYVLRGASTRLDNSLVRLNPFNTLERQLSFAIKDNPAPQQIKIEDNLLIVEEALPQAVNKVEVVVSSATRPEVAAITLEFAIVEKLSIDSLELFAINSNTDLLQENAVLYLPRNSSNIQNEIIELSVNSPEVLEINATLVDEFGNIQTSNANFAQIVRQTHNQETNTFLVEIAPGKQVGRGFIFFEIEYARYGYKYSTLENKTQIFAYDVIKNIMINNQIAPEVSTYKLFSEYADGFDGHEFIFSALPNTVAAEYKNFYIETNDYLPENLSESRIFIYTTNKQTNELELLSLTDGKLKIEDGEVVYLLANRNLTSSFASMTVVSEFSAVFHPGTTEEKRATLNFNIIRGVSSAEAYGFEQGQEKVVILDSDINRALPDVQKFYFAVAGEDVEIEEHSSFKVEGNFEVTKHLSNGKYFQRESFDSSINFETSQKALWSVNLSAKSNDVISFGKLTINFGNGRSLSINVKTELEFKRNNVTTTSQNINQNSGVGFYKENLENGYTSFSIAVKQGSSARVLNNLKQDTFDVSYTFFDALYSEDGASEYQNIGNYDFNVLSELVFAETSDVIVDADLNGYNIISSRQVGKVLVKAVYTGKVFEKAGLYQILRDAETAETVTKYFLVETYIPIVNFDASIVSNLLYSADTVGYYNRALSQTTITTTLNYGYHAPTYNNIIVGLEALERDTQLRVEQSAFNNDIYTITALTTSRGDDQGQQISEYRDGVIKFTVIEFDTVRVIRIPLIVRNAEKVSDIVLQNINQDEGIYLHVDRDTTFRIGARALNLSAFNTNFVYEFEADIGMPNKNEILTLNENTGLITLTGNKVGGTGIIKIIPQDAFVITASGQRELLPNNKVVKVVKVVIADGKSKETAIRISDLSEIDRETGTDKHYVLSSLNTIINSWQPIPSFSGGLYGRLTDEQDIAQITFANNSRALFGTLEEGAIVEDLILAGEVTGSSAGFVANTNLGTINNIVVDTKTDGVLYLASVVNSSANIVGGLVGINGPSGVVKNSNFFGKVVATGASYAGGIAGQNQGLIENAKVEFYTFETDNQTKSVGSVVSNGSSGGIVGHLSGGRIVLSYAYSYHNDFALAGNEIGGIAGSIEGATSQISKSFARTNASYIVGTSDVLNNGKSNFNITNSYFYNYQPTEDENQTPADTYNAISSGRDVYLNGIKYSYGSPVFTSTYQSYGINFGSASAWTYNTITNNGYPYLKELINEQATLNPLLNLIANNNLLVDTENKQAVFYYYQAMGGMLSLTSQEQAVVKNWNTHTFSKLFGFSNSNGIKAIVKTENGENASSYVRVHSNGIEILQVSRNLVLTVFSKYDFTTKIDFTISAIYAPGVLSATLENDLIYNNSSLSIKGGTTQAINAYFVSQAVLTNRLVTFMQQADLISDLIITNLNSPDLTIINTTASNVHIIDTTKFGEASFVRFEAFAKINNENIDDEHYINRLLKQNSTIRFSLSTYKGPFEITTNVKEIIRAMPYDKITFNVEVITDNIDEKLSLKITDENMSDTFLNGVKYNDLFMQNLSNNLSSIEKDGEAISLGGGKYKLTYTIKLEIQDIYKNLNFDDIFLFIEIKAEQFDAVSAHVDLIMASQEIQYINVFARELGRYRQDEGFTFKPQTSNNIAPGTSALLTLDLFPNLAYFDTIEITSSIASGQRISFSVLEYNGTYQRRMGGFRAIPNGISVNQDVLQGGENQQHLSSLYIYATVPSNVLLETTFTVFVKAFGANKEFLTGSEFIIIAKPLIAANVTINGASSAVVAKGTKADIVVEMEQNQWLGNDGSLDLFINSDAGDDAYYEGISITKPTEEINEQTGKRVYKAQLDVSVLARFYNVPNHAIDVLATVERRVGNVTETAVSFVRVYVVDFLIDFSSFKVVTDALEDNVVKTYIGVSKGLMFDVETTTWSREGAQYPERNQAIDDLESKVAHFKDHNHYFWQDPVNANSQYALNYHKDYTNNNLYKNYLNNLYYVNSNGTTTKVLSQNGELISSDIISFVYLEGGGVASDDSSGKVLNVEGKRTGTQNLRLKYVVLNPDGSSKEEYYDFAVRVEPFSDEDKPEQIYTADDFLAIASEEMAQDYILMEDIYLYEYVPFNTNNMRSFDGNNKVISIMSFDLDLEENSSVISLSLFNTVNENSTLKNITVNYYHLNKTLINTAKFKTINIAGFAIDNRGIITNSHVLANKFNENLPNSPKTNLGFEVVYSSGTTETKISQNITSNIAGFVITNSSGGSITNSRVGGTEFVKVIASQSQQNTHILRVFNISGQGSVSGFVSTNSGLISASFANNINIENQSDVKIQTITSGFVGANNGHITLSYSKGAYSTIYPNEIRATGSGISTTGIAAGFVYTNNGNISDSYSNIMIQDRNGNAGRGSAGFVYNNAETGFIDKAYTASLTQERNSSQMNFTGVDENLNILNSGVISNSYYYSPQSSVGSSPTEVEELYASGVLKVSSFTNLDAFYGFSFATVNSDDGVWKSTSGRGIDLVSANEIAISSRYIQSTGDDFVFHYASGYEYGKKVNPIIIRTAKEFDRVLGGETTSTPIKNFFDKDQQKIWGAYRLVSNINLNDLGISSSGEYNLSSTGMSLVRNAMFDGNNLTISNLQLYSSLEYNKKHLGLFASIEEGSIVKNLNVGLITVEANNVQNVGAITGALIDSKLANINLKSMSEDTSAKVLGQNVVGGIVGLVSGNSEIVGLSTQNISVEVDFFDRNIARQHFQRKQTLNDFNHQRLSFAGGIVGIIDIFTLDKYMQEEFFLENALSFSKSASLHVKGYGEIKAGTVGGVVGYVGVNTYIRDASYEIYEENPNRPQTIVSFKYAAGGIVGELNGGLTQSKIEHVDSLQNQIESNLYNYYSTSQVVTRGNMSLFKNTTTVYEPIFVGGLVGKIGSGEITNSYSKANVVMPTAKFVGGAIGSLGDFEYASSVTHKRVGNININEVYSFGDLRSSNKTESGAGGFIGFIEYLKANTLASNNMPIQVVIDGSNAIIYHTKDVAGLLTGNNGAEENTIKDVYDFYAYTKVDNEFLASTDYADKAREKYLALETFNDVVILREFGSGGVSSGFIHAYTSKDFVTGGKEYKFKVSTFGIKETSEQEDKIIEGNVTRLNEIANLASDGRLMDVIFRNNYWDENRWERKASTLLPKIVFTVSNSIFYIQTPEDFLLMEKNPDKIFIMIGGTPDSQGRRLIDMSSFTDEHLLNNIIRNFSGVLRGYVEDEESQLEIPAPKYGFKNLNITKSLIESSIAGAVFSDFIISQSGSSYSADGAILVKESEGTIFRNLIIENSTLTTSNESSGIITTRASNSIFDTIKLSSNLNRNIIDVNIETNEENKDLDNRVYSVGAIVGAVTSSIKTTFRNVEVKTTNNLYGIEINASTTVNSELVKNINMGGIYGLASQGSVEIISDTGENAFIKDVAVKFTSGNYASANTLLKDYYVFNAGLIGGRSEGGVIIKTAEGYSREVTGRIVANGTFNYITETDAVTDFGISAAVGGLFGHTSSLDIKFGGNRTFDVQAQIAVNNLIEGTEESMPIMAVAGVVGYAAGQVSLRNMLFANEFGGQSNKINKTDSSARAKDLIVVTGKSNGYYVGGIVGRARLQATIINSKISTGSKIKVEDKSTKQNESLSFVVVGGILGESSFANNTSTAQLKISSEDSAPSRNDTTFNGHIEIINIADVIAGGIVGAINRSYNAGSDLVSINTSEIGQSYFGGQIDIKRKLESNIVAGGILGSSDNKTIDKASVRNPIKVFSNITYGDINISDDNIGTGYINVGGVVGDGTNELNVSDNVSLTTLFSTRATSTTDNIFVSKAIVGGEYAKGVSKNNKYSSQVTLATDQEQEATEGDIGLAQNMIYKVLLDSDDLGKNRLDSLLFEEHSTLKSDLKNGHKLSPYQIESSSDLQMHTNSENQNPVYRTYFRYAEEEIDFDLEKPLEFTGARENKPFVGNQGIIGDGVKIKIINNKLQSGKASRMFDVIDKQSFVSGVSVIIDSYYYPETYEFEHEYYEGSTLKKVKYPYQIYGGLAAVNQGVIFGVNVQADKSTDIIDNSQSNFYSEIFLSQTTLAGGLVGLNQGSISDSFASVNIINVTDEVKFAFTTDINQTEGARFIDERLLDFDLQHLTLKEENETNIIYIRPIVSGFVGINQGDINSSYSVGVLVGYDSILYSFGADSKGLKYYNNVNETPTVRNSFALAQSSKAYTSVSDTGEQELFANVFGTGANSSNFYDVYATQTQDKNKDDKNNAIVKKYTTIQMTNNIDEIDNSLDLSNVNNLAYNENANFGYPSFSKAYKNFGFMRQETGNSDYKYIANAGLLQKNIENETEASKLSLYILNDFEITNDMGYVSNLGFNNVNTGNSGDLPKNANWNPLSLVNIAIYGRDNKISDFKVYATEANNGNRIDLGFFKNLDKSDIEDLTLANGEVVANISSGISYVGGFAGYMNSSNIKNSTNLGVRVQSDAGGYVGGIVGYTTSSGALIGNTNTGNVVSIFEKNENYENFVGVTINSNTTKAIAGGIFGYRTNAFTSNTNIIKDNINYGLVYSQVETIEIESEDENENPKVEYLYHSFASGIGTAPAPNNPVNLDNIYNENKGIAKVILVDKYANDVSSVYTNQNIQGVEKLKDSPDDEEEKISGRVKPMGEGTVISPFVITSYEEFNYVYDDTDATNNFNVLLNINIDFKVNEIHPDIDSTYLLKNIESSEDNEINIFGNNKLISYQNNLDSVRSFSLIDKINKDSKITNLNILGNYASAHSDISMLTKQNKGLIKQTNIYGSILPNINEYNDTNNKYTAGMALNNSGNILLSNNYALIKAIDGMSSEDSGQNGFDAVNIGGLVGETSGVILNSSNYGALIGGNGGKGYTQTGNADPGDLGENGKTGGNGTDGGAASIIGGVAAMVTAEQDTLIIGSNKGIIIGGEGGEGGDGQKGGNGGDAVEEYIDLYRGVTVSSISSLKAAWDILENIFSDNSGGDGGGGGAGGNGGNSIAGGIAGVSYTKKVNTLNNNSSVNAIIIGGAPGTGGKGGDGGDGGRGSVSMEKASATILGFNIAQLVVLAVKFPPSLIKTLPQVISKFNLSLLDYRNAGDGGGAGGTGFSGNTSESIQNSYFIDSESEKITALPGGTEKDSAMYGFGSKSESSMIGERGTSKNKTNFFNAIGPGADFHGIAKGGVGEAGTNDASHSSSNSIIGLSVALPEYDEENEEYLVDSWIGLLNLLASEQSLEGEQVYKLNKSFSFGVEIDDENTEFVSSMWRTLPEYEGIIDGGDNTIYITGNHADLRILSRLDKIKNLNIVLDIEGFHSGFIGKNQFVAPDFNLSSNNVKISGIVKSTKTIPWLREKYDTFNLPSANDSLKITGASTNITGTGTSSSPYMISQNAFEEFVTLIKETQSEARYKLSENITLTPTSVTANTFILDSFLGHLDGDGKTISLNTINIENTDKPYNSLIGTLGSEFNKQSSVRNLTLNGSFLLAGIANTNHGVIDNVFVGGSGNNSVYSSISGIVVDNYGTISNTTNNSKLSSSVEQAQVAGIALTNAGKLLNVINNGQITSLNGEAAGITITNTGLIDGATNAGNVTAGKGLTGIIFNNLSEEEKSEYENMFTIDGVLDEDGFNQFKQDILSGSNGFDAAGIAIYNYLEITGATKESFIEASGEDETIVLFGITNAVNSGAITAGAGGDAAQGGTTGEGGIASGIVVYNVIEDMEEIDGSYIDVVYVGYISSTEGKEVKNTGTIKNGNGQTVSDEKLKIIAVNEITVGETTYKGLYNIFEWETESEDD